MADISVIIPFYNSANTLARCINSLQNQRFYNFEAIFVDDGSTDSSFEICKDCFDGDSRFKVIHQENGGASSARNAGIAAAKGKYICFVDSDDEVNENYLSDLIANSNGCDLVIHGMMRVGKGVFIDRGMHIDGLYDLGTNPEVFFDDINIERFGGPVCKLFRADIIKENNLLFNTKIKLAEDLDFLLRYLVFCKTVRTESKNNYTYFVTEGSATSHLYGFETEFEGARALDESWSKLYAKIEVERLNILHKKCLAYYCSRLLPSLYSKETSLFTGFDRFKKIDSNILFAYSHYFSPKTSFLRVVKLCCRMRLYSVICFLYFLRSR